MFIVVLINHIPETRNYIFVVHTMVIQIEIQTQLQDMEMSKTIIGS